MSSLATFLALLSAVFAALVAIFGKIGLTKIDSTASTVVRSVIMTVFLVFIALFDKKIFTNVSGFDKKAWLFITLSGIAGALSWLSYFAAIKLGKTTAVVALDKSSLIVVWLLAMLFLGETFKLTTFVGVLLMTAGVILTVL